MPEKGESFVIGSLPLITQTPLSSNSITLPLHGAAQITETIGCRESSKGDGRIAEECFSLHKTRA
jgi:hypothetical protein